MVHVISSCKKATRYATVYSASWPHFLHRKTGGGKKKKLLIKPCAPSVSKSKGLMRAQRGEEIGSVPGR